MSPVASGTVTIPGSKSVTHRAFLLAAQSNTPCLVRNPLLSADTTATLRALGDLGARFTLEEGNVAFQPAPLHPPAKALDLDNAGTGLRLLTGLAARFGVPVTLTGDESLVSRPNGPLLAALQDLGVRVEAREGGRAPFTVTGPLRPGTARLPAAASSQYASALLLNLPFVAGDSTVELAAPVHSSPYLDLSLDAAAAFGLRLDEQEAETAGRTFHVPGGQTTAAARFDVEGDWSTAAFPLVAAAITGGDLTAKGLLPESRQGDRAITELLASFGATVDVASDHVRVRSDGALESPGIVDVSATPDLFPILTVLAACSRGTTTFVGGGQLRHKESDRISGMAKGLAAMGVAVEEQEEGLIVHGAPGQLRGATVASLDDHRLHMAFAIAGLVAEGPVHVDAPDCVKVSYPAFHADLARLTGRPIPEVAA
ncbi:MAG: 3-phosphoshikimate 1-carboxyvinyltransferase [Thermoplasmatota archaeon]